MEISSNLVAFKKKLYKLWMWINSGFNFQREVRWTTICHMLNWTSVDVVTSNGGFNHFLLSTTPSLGKVEGSH